MLQVDNLTKVYGTQKALDGVSFSVQAAQVAGLLGPNGAGKSTLMKIVCGYLAPTSGTAFVCGLDVREHSLETRAMIGYLPEHNPLYLDMYVREYLDFVGKIHMPAEKVARCREEVIARTGLGAEACKKIKALSKGYRQRVGLAQALIHDPAVLILDEPTSGVDVLTRKEFWNHLNALSKIGVTILITTHFMDEAEYCHRISLFYQGKAIAIGSPVELKKRANAATLNEAFINLVHGSEGVGNVD